MNFAAHISRVKILRWAHFVFELAIIVAITALFVRFGYKVFRSEEWKSPYFVSHTIQFIDLHWKGTLLVFLPLFYRSITKAIERLAKIPWAEFEKPSEPEIQDVVISPIPTAKDKGV